MDSLIKEHAKLAAKQLATQESTFSTLDSLITSLNLAKASLALSDSAFDAQQLLETAKQASAQLSESHKELQLSLSKYSKALEKRFKNVDVNSLWDPKAIDGKEDILDKAITMHFIRDGKFEVSEFFQKESKIPSMKNDSMDIDEFSEMKEQLREMHKILLDLKQGNIESSLLWAQENREFLEQRGSSLEFMLHKLKFVEILTKQDKIVALEYIKSNILHIGQSHVKDIQKLTCALAFSHRLSTSPYGDLISSQHYQNTVSQFTSDFCSLLSLSTFPPLLLLSQIGSTALPTIQKVSSILSSSSGMEWTSTNELPVEIPLLPSQRFHSIFICPVSKEQGTEANPPMMLQCGHIVCKETLGRLSKGSASSRFKCPYCPVESTAVSAIRVYF